MRILKVEGASPLEGCVPLLGEGKIIGTIGVSGVTSWQDGQIAQAGANALKRFGLLILPPMGLPFVDSGALS